MGLNRKFIVICEDGRVQHSEPAFSILMQHTWIYRVVFLFLCLLGRCYTFAQSNPVYLQDFGTGNEDPNTIGNPLPPGATFFNFEGVTCPAPGNYTIVRRIPINSCFNNGWILLTRDDSPNNVDFGFCMLINNHTDPNNRLVYKDTVYKSLCPGTTYHYGFSVINVSSRTPCVNGPDFPVLEYRLEDGNGALLFKDTTRPWVDYAETPPPGKYVFNKFGFDFNLAVPASKLVIKINLLHKTYDCAEDFAIDNVIIYPVGPDASIAFDNEPPATIVKSVCFQQNKTFSITGTVGNYYANTALQWQQSTDSGRTWTDITGATSLTYTKTFSVPDTFIYRLTAAEAAKIGNINCRVTSNTLRVNVNGLPTNYSITSNSPVCSGQPLSFNANGASHYIWTGPNGFFDNIPYPGIFASSLADSGTYYVQVFSNGGCSTTDSIHVKIIGTDVHAWPDTSICKGRTVMLNASQGAAYSWVPADGLSNTMIRNPVAHPLATTTFIVTVTDKDGCSDTAHATIQVINKTAVVAGISGAEFICRPADSASFNDASTGAVTQWNWDFGNGQTASDAKPPTQYYSITGNEKTFTVRLAVADSLGCTDTSYHIITVANNCYIAVPNAFTPNGDGSNDYLYPLNAYKATNLSFRVYNRFGLLVFETRDWTNKWNGKVNGVLQASGAYVWILQYTDAAGKRIKLKGTSILVR